MTPEKLALVSVSVSGSDVRDTRKTGVGVSVGVGFSDTQNLSVGVKHSRHQCQGPAKSNIEPTL